jgi:hypothetical protein
LTVEAEFARDPSGIAAALTGEWQFSEKQVNMVGANNVTQSRTGTRELRNGNALDPRPRPEA